MFGKKYTRKKYSCSICNGSYSRKWVLNRHVNSIHLDENKESADNNFLFGRSAKEPTKSFSTKQQHYNQHHPSHDIMDYSEQMKIYRMVFRNLQNCYSPILYNNVLLSNTLSNIMQNNIFVPIEQISGFSGYACPSCHTFQFTPIKDLGFDKTAKGKHQCRYERIEEIKNLPNRKHYFSKIIVPLFNSQLQLLANQFTTESKTLVARRLQDNVAIEDGIKQHRYPYSELIDTTSTWLDKVITKGEIELSADDLADFVVTARGSYAVFPIYPINTERNFGYVLIYLQRPNQKDQIK